MVYEWDAHKETCYRLYVEEGRSLEAVVQHMKNVHHFTPSKRAYQLQFSRWKFPTKLNPPHKDARLVERVKELWEKNVSSREMVRVLNEEDGFNIKPRELSRVRSKFRLLLRVPNGDKSQRRELEASTSEGAAQDDGVSTTEAEAISPSDMGQTPSPQPTLDPSAEANQPAHEDSTSSAMSTRKRRRMLAQTADSTTPAARFPSEMTFRQARLILDLDAEMYRSLRSRFHQICIEENVVKKTVAGPQQWDAVKQRLITELPYLQEVLKRSRSNLGPPNLALDVICTDVTKRIRISETRMSLAQAKNALGVNPAESRQLRVVFRQVLDEAHFTSKSDTTSQQWLEIKRKWGERSEIVKSIICATEAGSNNQSKNRALDLLARDVVKRMREDRSLKRIKSAEKQLLKEAKFTRGLQRRLDNDRNGATDDTSPSYQAELGVDLIEDEMDIRSEVSLPHPPMDNEQRGSSRTSRMPTTPQPQTPRMPAPVGRLPQPARILGISMAQGIPLDTQTGAALLMTSNSQTEYLNQSYIQHQFTPSPSNNQVYNPVIASSSSFAVYLRLHPSSSFVTNAGLWIATVHSQSVQELRQAAVGTFPSALCVRVEGILKDGKGGELSLPIEQDQELGAYLAHLQGAAPTFRVQLAWKTS